jgi:hypothetical protein
MSVGFARKNIFCRDIQTGEIVSLKNSRKISLVSILAI